MLNFILISKMTLHLSISQVICAWVLSNTVQNKQLNLSFFTNIKNWSCNFSNAISTRWAPLLAWDLFVPVLCLWDDCTIKHNVTVSELNLKQVHKLLTCEVQFEVCKTTSNFVAKLSHCWCLIWPKNVQSLKVPKLKGLV